MSDEKMSNMRNSMSRKLFVGKAGFSVDEQGKLTVSISAHPTLLNTGIYQLLLQVAEAQGKSLHKYVQGLLELHSAVTTTLPVETNIDTCKHFSAALDILMEKDAAEMVEKLFNDKLHNCDSCQSANSCKRGRDYKGEKANNEEE